MQTPARTYFTFTFETGKRYVHLDCPPTLDALSDALTRIRSNFSGQILRISYRMIPSYSKILIGDFWFLEFGNEESRTIHFKFDNQDQEIISKIINRNAVLDSTTEDDIKRNEKIKELNKTRILYGLEPFKLKEIKQ